MTARTHHQTNAMLRRKVERLEGIIAFMQEHQKRINAMDYKIIYKSADNEIRIKQAIEILQGEVE